MNNLNARTNQLNTRLNQTDARVDNLQTQVNALASGGVGSNGGATVQQVLNAIQAQGFLDLGARWRIGNLPGGEPSFFITDKLSTGINFYEFMEG